MLALLTMALPCLGQTNHLFNSGFEINYAGNNTLATNWNYAGGWTNGGYWGSAARANWQTHGGSWEGAIRGSWSGSDFGGFWQERPAVAGSSYVASAWFWADVPGTYSGGPWTAAVKKLMLDFYSPTFALLQSSTTLLNGIVEQWTQLSVTATAPVSAEWARVVFWVEGASAYGALHIDDAALAFGDTPSNPPPPPPTVFRYVSKSGSHTPPYTNWAMAATDLVSACSASASGDVVFVTNGTYATGTQTLGWGSLNNRVAVPHYVTLTSVNGPALTTIVGKGPIGSSAVRCAQLGFGARLSGFTLTNGHTRTSGFPEMPDYSGGGVHLLNGSVVSNCIIVGNRAYQDGGGAYVEVSHSAQVLNCRIEGNTAKYGGGAYFYNYGTIANCIVLANVATQNGGGIYTDLGTVENCLVYSNRATARGGGIYFSRPGNARHCTVVTNEVNSSTGAGGIDAWSFAHIDNCILYWNSSPSPSNDNWQSTTPGEFYNCCTTRTNGMSQCTTNEPQFVDRDNSNFRPKRTSPCIDTGDNLSISNDIAGRPRPIDGNQDGTNRADIGAYEYDPEIDDSDADGMPDHWELAWGLDAGSATNAASDPDGDGYGDLAEYLADTEPTNGQSRLQLLGIDFTGTNAVRFGPSSTGRLYTLEFADSLVDPAWSNVTWQTDEPGSGTPTNALRDVTDSPTRLYRLLIRKP